jgi:hypothetical protein
MYMMRLVYHCQRGKTPEVVDCLKTLNHIYTGDGCTNGKVYIDRMERMDRAIYEFEIESLDRFYAVLRERYANLSNLGQEAQQLVHRLNQYAVEGARELYDEVIV